MTGIPLYKNLFSKKNLCFEYPPKKLGLYHLPQKNWDSVIFQKKLGFAFLFKKNWDSVIFSKRTETLSFFPKKLVLYFFQKN